MLKNLTDKNFHDEVRETTEPVVILFSGSWCEPCKRFKPTYEKMAEHKKSNVKFMMADIEQCEGIAADLSIRSVPTLVMFADGMVRDVRAGTMQLYELREWIDDNV